MIDLEICGSYFHDVRFKFDRSRAQGAPSLHLQNSKVRFSLEHLAKFGAGFGR